MQTSIAREFEFCYGHRLLNHEGKCRNLHGHNGKLTVYAKSLDQKNLDKIGRVIDFSIIKNKIGSWIDEHWDHKMILKEDDMYVNLLREFAELAIVHFNPTVENMLEYLITDIFPPLFKEHSVCIYKAEMYETSKCKGTIELTDEETKSLYRKI